MNPAIPLRNANGHIRAAKAEDMNFVMKSWKQSWRVSPWAGCVRNDEYYKSIESTIEGLVARGASFLVAVFGQPGQEVSGRLMGWVCYEVLGDRGPDGQGTCAVHYLYVKDPFIRLNIAKDLLNACPGNKPGLYSFRYHQVAEACAHNEGWRHAPEIARRK